MWDFLQQNVAERALLACLMIGFANGYVSGFVVLRKSALAIGTLSCALLPGIALAVLLFGLGQLAILGGAVFAALLVGLGSLFVARTSRIDADTSLSLVHTLAFAIGYLILLSLGLQQKIDEWLFGSIFGMSDADLWLAYGISALAMSVLIVFQRPLLIMLFEPNIAASLGIPVRFLNYALFGLVILVLVSSMQAVGAYLSIGLLVAPAASVSFFTDRPSLLLWGGGVVGGLGSLAAFFLAFALGWNVSPTIILVQGLIFIGAYMLSPKYGLFSKFVNFRR